MGNTPAKKTAARKRTAPKRTALDEHKARQEDLEARVTREFEQAAEDANDALDDLERTVVQKEWLLITLRLDRTRDQIARDGSLRLLAMAWIKEKRDHGGADWDRLLNMTDEELADLHGFPTETPQETIKRLQAAAQDPTEGTQDDPDAQD